MPMHVMFIHPNFPAQFGQAAYYLSSQLGWKCTYVTSVDTTDLKLPFDHLNYRVHEGTQPKVFHNPENRLVTYVSPGLESVRRFDIFMKAAKIIAQQVPKARFLIAGDERSVYGHEMYHIGEQSFKQWVLSQDQYPLDRFHFLGLIPP